MRRVGLGFHADLPDIRDHGPEELAKFRSGRQAPVRADGPEAVAGYRHLGEFGPLPVIEDQGPIGSCTAQAVIGMAEIQILRQTGRALDLSRMFLYKSTRRLLGWSGDTGAFVRTTIKALRLFGSVPEEYWPYRAEFLDAEPDAFTYSYAQSFQGLRYARLDRYGGTGDDALSEVKTALDGGDPVAFGFTVYRSIGAMGADFTIPVPPSNDPRVGGHAVIAVGYNDHVPVPGQAGPGALIIRNSWGEGWGDHGYAYLPYWYVENQVAVDFWSLYGQEWIDVFAFDQPQATTAGADR